MPAICLADISITMLLVNQHYKPNFHLQSTDYNIPSRLSVCTNFSLTKDRSKVYSLTFVFDKFDVGCVTHSYYY